MDDLDARLRRRLAALADAAASHEQPVPFSVAALPRRGRTHSALPIGGLALAAVLVVALVAVAPRLGGQFAVAPSGASSQSATPSTQISATASATPSATASPTVVPEKPSPWPVEAPSPSASPAPDPERFSASAVAFFDRQHGLVGGDSAGQGVIWRTDDGGVTYEKQLLPGLGILGIAVIGSSEAWASTAAGLFHSTDAGRTWQEIGKDDLGSISFVDSRRGWAVQSDTPAQGGGPLLSTTDGGRTWTLEPAPCDYNGAVSVSFVDALHGWVGCSWPAGAGQGPKGISATTDGGKTWRLVAADPWPPGPDIGQISISGYLTGLAMRPSGIGFDWAARGVTEKTVDGGQTWTEIPPGSFDEVEVLSAWLLDDRNWLALVRDGAASAPQTLQATSDGGQTWHVVSDIPLPPY
jgi:photosystem II stability/assembly factor-like uncharacterized protein